LGQKQHGQKFSSAVLGWKQNYLSPCRLSIKILICMEKLSVIYTVRHKKLHHFVFAITLSYLFLFEYLLVHMYRDKFGTN